MKRCIRCKEDKSLDHFWSNRATKDGYCVYCRECMKSYYEPLKQKRCAFDGCNRISATAQFCQAHRRQVNSGLAMGPIPSRMERIRVSGPGTKCKVDDCPKEVHCNGFCQSHDKMRRQGKEVVSLSLPVACEGCKQDFARSDYRQVYCVPCKAISAKMRSYGLTAADWFRLLKAQGGTCAVPGCTESDSSKFHVDHDHACCPGVRACGKCVRGLLCHLCNIAAGSLMDDPKKAEGLAHYLRSTKVLVPQAPDATCAQVQQIDRQKGTV